MTQTLTPPGTPPGGYPGVPTCSGLIGRPVGHFLSVSAKSIFFRGKKGKLRGTPSVKISYYLILEPNNAGLILLFL